MNVLSTTHQRPIGDLGSKHPTERVQLTIVGLNSGHDEELRSVVDALLVPGLAQLLLRDKENLQPASGLNRGAAPVKKAPCSIPGEGRETQTHQSQSSKTG